MTPRPRKPTSRIRAVIYTRVSTDHGLEQDDGQDDDEDGARIESLRQAPHHSRTEAPQQPQPGGQPQMRADLAEQARAGNRALHQAEASVHQQTVADAARGLQVDGVGGVRLDLAAQPVDLDVDGAFAAAIGDF